MLGVMLLWWRCSAFSTTLDRALEFASLCLQGIAVFSRYVLFECFVVEYAFDVGFVTRFTAVETEVALDPTCAASLASWQGHAYNGGVKS